MQPAVTGRPASRPPTHRPGRPEKQSVPPAPIAANRLIKKGLLRLRGPINHPFTTAIQIPSGEFSLGDSASLRPGGSAHHKDHFNDQIWRLSRPQDRSLRQAAAGRARIRARTAALPDNPLELDEELFSALGAQIGGDNESLRNLLLDASAKIGELDTIKAAVAKLADPVSKTLRAFEAEKSEKISLQTVLNNTRTAYGKTAQRSRRTGEENRGVRQRMQGAAPGARHHAEPAALDRNHQGRDRHRCRRPPRPDRRPGGPSRAGDRRKQGVARGRPPARRAADGHRQAHRRARIRPQWHPPAAGDGGGRKARATNVAQQSQRRRRQPAAQADRNRSQPERRPRPPAPRRRQFRRDQYRTCAAGQRARRSQ